MTIKIKTSIIILILFSIITLSISIIQRFIVLPAFISLEKKEATDDMKRVVDALGNEIDHLNVLCNDWATWDDTYSFSIDESEDFITSNLTDDIFNEAGLNLIYIINTDGKVIWGKTYNTDENREIYLTEIPLDVLPKEHPIINIKNNTENLAGSNILGIFNTEKGPLLISTELILTSDANGPSHGYMIMGIFLHEELIKQISSLTSVNFDITYLYNNADIESYKTITDNLNDKQIYIEKNKMNNYDLYSYFYDIDKNPSFLINISFLRDISMQGRRIINYATISFIITGLIVLLLSVLLVNKYILHPILLLDKHMIEIIKNNDFSIRLTSTGKDEIGELTTGFNYFVEKIEMQRKQLHTLSTIDALTNIGNRRKFDEVLHSEWNRHKRYKEVITLLLIDIDYFKNYNDFYGHQAGDECLKKVGQILKNKTKRAGELAARYGGEEFAIIFSNSNKEDVIKVSNLLIAEMKNLNIKHEKSAVAEFVTFSIGIAYTIPENSDDIKDFISMADKALYKAKESGRNRFCLHQEPT